MITNTISHIVTHIKQHRLLTAVSLFHLTLMLCVAPFATNYAYCSDYAFTFPTGAVYNYTILSLGYLLAICLILWFYHYYLPYVWGRQSFLARLFFLFLLSFYIVYILSSYPYMYALDGDYTAIYDTASHGLPLFWQSYLTSIVYLGYYLIFCHPASIIFVEVILFCVLAGYLAELYLSMVPVEKKKLRLCICSIFFLLVLCYVRIGSMALIPHRVFLWGTFAVYHVGVVFYHLLNKNTLFIGSRHFYLQAVLSGILAFWRTEGILFLFWMPLSFLLLALFHQDGELAEYRKLVRTLHIKRVAAGFLLSALACLLAYLPQIGINRDYYGNDYMLINYTGYLKEMLLDEELNLSYEGAEDDLAVIDSFTSLPIVKLFGSGAYHYAAELKTGNCTTSGLTDEEKGTYIDAVESLIAHNPTVFLKSRVMVFLKTNNFIEEQAGDPDIYYNEYLTGYGDYQDAVIEQILSYGYRPVFLNAMYDSFKQRIGHSKSNSAFYLALLLSLEVFAIFISFIQTVSTRTAALLCSPEPISFIKKGILYLGMFLLGGWLFRIYRWLLEFNWFSSIYNQMQPFIEVILLTISIFLFVHSVKKKHILTAATYLFLYTCSLLILLFAPIDYWVYYTGIYNCLFCVIGFHLLSLFQCRKYDRVSLQT